MPALPVECSETVSDVHVVAAAIVRDGCVLAARRTRPAALAGGWEFPGGKVEPGEDGPGALARECREELGVEIRVGALLGTAQDAGLTLQLYAAGLLAGEPQALQDHDQVRWLSAQTVRSVDWLGIDTQLLPARRAAVASVRRGGHGVTDRSRRLDGARRPGRAGAAWTRSASTAMGRGARPGTCRRSTTR